MSDVMSVVVVGSINQDLVARVSRIPAPGETVLASSTTRSGGGKGANQAVAARRAGGVSVALAGAVGTDQEGASLRNALDADGIDVSGLAQVAGPTGMALISVDDEAENAIIVIPGANAVPTALSPAQRTLVARARVVLTQLEVPVSVVRDAAAARDAHAWHVLNAEPSAPFLEDAEGLLSSADVLVVNEHEAMDVSQCGNVDDAVAHLAPRVRALVVTLGSRGALVVCGRDQAQVPAFAAAAVDTTGAGDTFCGVFAATLAASGRPPASVDIALLADAARRGAAAASIAVTRAGAQDAVPTASEVAAVLERTPA